MQISSVLVAYATASPIPHLCGPCPISPSLVRHEYRLVLLYHASYDGEPSIEFSLLDRYATYMYTLPIAMRISGLAALHISAALRWPSLHFYQLDYMRDSVAGWCSTNELLSLFGKAPRGSPLSAFPPCPSLSRYISLPFLVISRCILPACTPAPLSARHRLAASSNSTIFAKPGSCGWRGL